MRGMTPSGRIFSGFLITAFLALQTASGEPVSPQRALEAARGWLALTDAKPMEKALGSGILSLLPGRDANGRTLYYAVYLENGGFLAMAPDDQLEPVLAFSAKEPRLSDPSPCNHLRLLLESDLPALLDAAKSRTKDATKAKTSKWELLEAAARAPQKVKGGLPGVSDMRVAPLIRTHWGQGNVDDGSAELACYNYYTPPFEAGAVSNYVCGCVATAYAQLLRFYKRPGNSVGTVRYPIEVDGVEVSRRLRGGDGAGGKYDWDNMPADPANLALAGTLTEAQRQAIGALCHDAGVAGRMSYTSTESGAYLEGRALQETFGYLACYAPSYGTGTPRKQINQFLNADLDGGMPCAIGIRSETGGHAVLVDGYGYAFGALYHHLNMGWDGYGDSWYLLPPADAPGAYTQVSEILCDIWPMGKGGWGVCGQGVHTFFTVSGQVTSPRGKPLAGVQIVAEAAGIIDCTPINRVTAVTDANGRYTMKVPSDVWTVKPQAAGASFQPASIEVTYCRWKTDFQRVAN